MKQKKLKIILFLLILLLFFLLLFKEEVHQLIISNDDRNESKSIMAIENTNEEKIDEEIKEMNDMEKEILSLN